MLCHCLALLPCPYSHDIHLLFLSVSNSWSSVEVKGDIPAGRSAASLVAVGNKLYLFGGLSHMSGWTDSLHVFDLGMLFSCCCFFSVQSCISRVYFYSVLSVHIEENSTGKTT